MTLLSPPLMTFVLLCLLFILIFSPLPWLTLTSRLISWRTCYPLSLMISPLFVRVISLWMRFCLLSVGWPDLRPTCPPRWQRSSLLWLFLSSGLASVSSLCHDPVPSFWWFSVVSVLYKVWALPPLAGPHSCLVGFCLLLVFCCLLCFPGLFPSTPGFCRRFIAVSFWPGVA